MAKSLRTTTSAASGTVTAPTGLTIGDQVVLIATSDTASATLTPPSDGNTWTEIVMGSESGGAASTLGAWWSTVGSAPANFTVAGATIAATICTAINPGGDTVGTPSLGALTTANSAGAATITSSAVNASADSVTLFFANSDDASGGITTPPTGMTQEAFQNLAAIALTAYSLVDANNAAYTNSLTWTNNSIERMAGAISFPYTAGGDTAALTGTAASGQTEQRNRTGGNTIIATLTGDTWTATFDATVQDALTAGLDSAQAEAAGWNATVRDAATNPITWVRTSDTIATGTLAAVPTYQITATETITFTIPASALTGGVAIVASPTFTVTRGAMDLVQPVGVTNASGVPSTSSGSLTGDVAQLTRVTCTIDGVTLDTVRVITSR